VSSKDFPFSSTSFPTTSSIYSWYESIYKLICLSLIRLRLFFYIVTESFSYGDEELSEESRITIGNKPIADYIVSIAILFNQGVKRIIIKGKGDKISKAVAVYNAVKDRMGDVIKLENVRIGSEDKRGKLVSFIEITIEKLI